MGGLTKVLRRHHSTSKDPRSVLLSLVTSASQHKEHVRRRCKQSQILIFDTKTGGQDGQNIEYNNSEKKVVLIVRGMVL